MFFDKNKATIEDLEKINKKPYIEGEISNILYIKNIHKNVLIFHIIYYNSINLDKL